MFDVFSYLYNAQHIHGRLTNGYGFGDSFWCATFRAPHGPNHQMELRWVLRGGRSCWTIKSTLKYEKDMIMIDNLVGGLNPFEKYELVSWDD